MYSQRICHLFARFLLIIAAVVLTNACQFQNEPGLPKSYLSENWEQLRFVCETPTGSVAEIKWSNPDQKIVEQKAYHFLPIPFNKGFVQLENQAEGEILPAILLSEPVRSGDVIETEILCAFNYQNQNENQTILILLPEDQDRNYLGTLNFDHLLTTHDPLRFGIESWFANAFGMQSGRSFRWIPPEQIVAD